MRQHEFHSWDWHGLKDNVDSDIQAPGCSGMKISVGVYKHRHRQTDTYMQIKE